MFHRYVFTSARRSVDFDRAKWLMDRKLLAYAWNKWKDREDEIHAGHAHELNEFAIAQGWEPRERQPLESQFLQYVWNTYREAHLQKYGSPFEPDVSPDWDA